MNARDLLSTEIARQANLIAPALSGAVRSSAGPANAFVVPPDYLAFRAGSLGGFPYVWQDPATLQFNALSYSWISAALDGGTGPVAQQDIYTNRFSRVFGSLVYTLGASDRQRLTAAQNAIVAAQGALLAAWQATFKTIPAPTPGARPIDLVVGTIVSEWSAPPTDLAALIAAKDPQALLDRAPAGTATIVQALLRFVAACGEQGGLINAVSAHNGMVRSVMDALIEPSPANGALPTTAGPQPAYAVATSVAAILNGLNDTNASRRVAVSLAATRGPTNTFQIASGARAGSAVALSDLLQIDAPGGGDILASALNAASGSATVSLSFPGATAVDFAPVPFDPVTRSSWFWTQPIRQALQAKGADTTGFRFSPDPFDGNDGPGNGYGLGYIAGLIISLNPSIAITTGTANAPALSAAFAAVQGGEVTVMGRRLGAIGATDEYETAEVTEGSSYIASLTQRTPAPTSPDARAFVLAVKRVFATDATPGG